MNNNNRKKLNLYTQGQRWAARVLLVVGLLGSFSSESVLARGYGGPRLVRGLETAVLGTLGLLGGGVGLKVAQQTQFSDNCEQILQGHSLEDNYRFLIERLSQSEGPCDEFDMSEYFSLQELKSEEDNTDEPYVDIIKKVLEDCRQDYDLSELYWRLSEESEQPVIIQIQIPSKIEDPITSHGWTYDKNFSC